LQGDGTHGTYADYVLVKADKLVKKPATLSFNQAAALPLAGLTAWQVIVGQMNLQPGEKILVQAGAGGVGLFAIQIAHHLGAYVATTASPANHDLLKSLGADEVIDYHQGPIIDFLHDYDAVFDTINQIPAGMAILKPTGRLVSIVAAPTEADQAISPARASFWRLKSNGQDLQKLTDLVEEGAIKIVIDSVFPLTVEGVRQAQTKSEDGHTHGKIVLAAEE
ncbi:NADP-dependent oxidoreductase, partial [Fructobacillus ficulneus]